MRTTGKRIISIVAGLVTASGITVMTPAVAGAIVPHVTCLTGTETETFAPGLRDFVQPVHFTANARLGTESALLPCVSTDLSLTGGHYTVDVTSLFACSTILAGGPAQFVVHWNNGQQSTLTGNSTVQDAGGQAVSTVTGTVTSGQFVNDKWRLVLTAPLLDLARCANPPGITNRNGVINLVIAPVLV
jgi:hypothetical protein